MQVHRSAHGVALGISSSLAATCTVFIIVVASAHAQEWELLRSPGLCSYEYDRVRDRTTTTCHAMAYLLDRVTSQVVRCEASVTGTENTAPSVPETSPESIDCRKLGRVFRDDGSYGIGGLDDNAMDENRRVRRQGRYVWSNAYWVYSRTGALNVRLCAGRHDIANPDFGQRCSRAIAWPDG